MIVVINNIKTLIPVSYGVHGNAPISNLRSYDIYQVNLFMTKITNFVKLNGPITSNNAPLLYKELCYSKPHQHLLSYLLPELRLSVNELNKSFPEVSINTTAQFINTTEGFSIIVFRLYKTILENSGYGFTDITLLPNVRGSCLKPMQEFIACKQNTGQDNPDALVTLYDKSNHLLCKRYYDAKLGDSSGFNGNVMIANDSQELLDRAIKLLNKQYNQLGQWKYLFAKFPCLNEVFMILNDRKLDPLKKLALTQTILRENIHKLPPDCVPSVLIDGTQPYDKDILDYNVERDIIKDYSSTKRFFESVFKYKIPPKVTKTILESEGVNHTLKESILMNTPFLKALSNIL